MKSSNLAHRIEPPEAPFETQPQQLGEPVPRRDEPSRARRRPRFDQRTIEIRDQGLALFRVR
jgi:hypothetical protein